MTVVIVGVVIGTVAWATTGYFIAASLEGISPLTGALFSAFFGAVFCTFAAMLISRQSG